MAFYQDKFVITCAARVLWDGITRPESLDDGGKKYTLKVGALASSPEIGELEAIAMQALQQDQKFNGQLPPGGIWPLGDVKPGEFGDMIQGHKVFNTSTYQVPDVFDINGQKLDPVHYGAMFYPGATVQLIVCAKTFDNRSRGVKFELHGVKIIDATSPKLPVASSVDAAAAFGAAPATATPPAGNMPPAATPAPGAAPGMPPAASSAMPQTAAPAASSVVPAAGNVTPPPAPQAAPTPPPQPAHDFLTVNGQQFTAEQLRAGGWTEEQINAAR